MKPVMRFGVALALVGAIGACSGDSTGPTFENVFSEEEGAEMAGNAGESVYFLLDQMQWGTPSVLLIAPTPAQRPFLAPRMGAHRPRFTVPTARTSIAALVGQLQTVAPGCTTTASGTDGDSFKWYDGNENFVADDWHVKQVCTGVDSVGEDTFAWTERIEISVKELTSGIWGYEASLEFVSGDKGSDGSVSESGFRASERLSVTHERADLTSSTKQWSKVGEEGDIDYHEFSGEGAGHYVPTGGALNFDVPFQAGTVTLDLEQRMLDAEDENVRWNVDTPEAVGYSPDCLSDMGQAFVGGQIRGRLNGSTERGFTIDVHGCGEGWSTDLFGFEGEVLPTRQARR